VLTHVYYILLLSVDTYYIFLQSVDTSDYILIHKDSYLDVFSVDGGTRSSYG